MKRLGVILIVLGLVAALVACYPGIAGEKNPAPGFGPQQITALIVGLVLVVVGLVVWKCGKCKCACAAEPAKAAAEEPPAEEPAPEAEEPAPGETAE
ncbi:MAG: hypothetical protein ABIF82_03730 [Planctomycetota bacterium]